jgi:molybdenum cofactor biosynthesis protein MoaC
MTERWIKVFRKRSATTGDVEGNIAWDEVNADGIGFLKPGIDEVKNALETSEPFESESVPLTAQNTELLDTKRSAQEHHDIIKDAEITFNQDEFDAGGMSFLKDDNVDATENLSEPSEQPNLKNRPHIALSRKPSNSAYESTTRRLYSTSSRPPLDLTLAPKSERSTSRSDQANPAPSLPHLTPSGSAHMVSVSAKAHTIRTAIAVGTVYFSNATPLTLIKSNSLKKGDVLSVSRIAGIMAAKKCPDLIPLCHPIPLTHVGVELQVFSPEDGDGIGKVGDGNDMGFGGVRIEAKVSCTGPTGVEMEALTSVMGTALSVVDMCKAVDKFQRVQDVRVVLKEGGKSGWWAEEGWKSFQQ